ncbi:Ig-like domain-containing protein, partial [Planctomycetota bacterium]
FSKDGTSSFDAMTIRTSDPALEEAESDNTTPVAADDAGTTNEDAPVSIDVLANDSDPDVGDTLTIASVTQGTAGGAVSIDNSHVNYDPAGWFDYLAQDETATDTFGYTISDSSGALAIATVSITIIGINDTPIAQNDAAGTTEDAGVTINVLGNDSDPDANDILTISEFTQGVNGGLVSTNGSSIYYDPHGQFDDLVLGQTATDNFTYTLNDSNGATATATVTVTVSGIADNNIAPIAVDDAFATHEDTLLLIAASTLLSNDSDADGDVLAIESLSQPAHGLLVDNDDGTYTYTPDADYNGSDSFSYVVSDGRGGGDSAVVNLTVASVNDAPVAQADAFSMVENTSLTIITADLLANDSDVDGDVLSIAEISQPANGILNSGSDTLTYIPKAGFTGTDTFTYRAGDSLAMSSEITVAIEVTPSVAGTYTYSMEQSIAIPDNSSMVSTIEVDDVYHILDINVQLNIDHTRDQDLRVVLVSPSGTRIEMFSQVGGRGDGFIGTVLDDSASTAIANGSAPFTDVYRPSGDLSALEGENVNGTWILEISDLKKKETGTLNAWSIIVERGLAMQLDSSSTNVVRDGAYVEPLNSTTLSMAVTEASRYLVDSSQVESSALGVLSEVDFEVTDLAGSVLGLAGTNTILIDIDAAGQGWFIDLTVGETREDLGQFLADTCTAGRVDLLTVVTHEIGHLLGLDHSASENVPFMSETLAAGERLITTAGHEVLLDGEGLTLRGERGRDTLEGGADYDRVIGSRKYDWVQEQDTGSGLLGLQSFFEDFHTGFAYTPFFFVDPNESDPSPTDDRPVRQWVQDFLDQVLTLDNGDADMLAIALLRLSQLHDMEPLHT